MTPGYGGNITCEPWREGQSQDASGLCFNNADVTNKRLYELEVQVSQLQQQVQQQANQRPQQTASQAAPQAPQQVTTVVTGGVSQKDFDMLASRVTGLEKALAITQSLLAKLTTVVNALKLRVK
jgi:outer membrane murein-binding lipoprotein Lpp